MLSGIKLARASGFIYLLLILTGIFGIVYVPSTLIAWDNPALTAENIMASEFMFRLGVVSEIFCFVCFIILPLFLFELFKSVNSKAALLMVVLALLSVPIFFVNVINHVNVLLLLSGAEYLKAIPTDYIHAQVMYLLASFNNGNIVSNVLWGAWLLPFGYLVFKSGFLPKILGVFLMLGCLSYLAEFVGRLLFSMKDIPWYISMPSSVGEFGICLWLLIFGVKENPGESR